MPRIRRAVGRYLTNDAACKRLATAAVVRLVAKTALRAGSDSYARERGTRGATTLLKSNVVVQGGTLRLRFRAKGSQIVTCQLEDRRLSVTIRRLLTIPGRRLFQYRDGEGSVHQVSARDVNEFLREISGRRISLKDFRTLIASADVLDALVVTTPAKSQRARRAQIRKAIASAADTLANTPAVCRSSYVHDSVIAAFEQGALPQPAARQRTFEAKALALARVVRRNRTDATRSSSSR
jgi:DNA topoisomerase-1